MLNFSRGTVIRHAKAEAFPKREWSKISRDDAFTALLALVEAEALDYESKVEVLRGAMEVGLVKNDKEIAGHR